MPCALWLILLDAPEKCAPPRPRRLDSAFLWCNVVVCKGVLIVRDARQVTGVEDAPESGGGASARRRAVLREPLFDTTSHIFPRLVLWLPDLIVG